jgi:Recombination directionality factor-like
MGILGLTHDQNGVALEKLPVTIKVAIGEGPQPSNQNGHPRPLDHFVFKRKRLHGQDVIWESASDIGELFGEKPTEIGIMFLHDDPKEVFRTELAWWTSGGYKCHGELVQIANGGEPHFEMRAVRKTQKCPQGEAWPGDYKFIGGPRKGEPLPFCGEGCPDLKRGDCRPSGDLYFVLERFPRLGAVCRLHTSSYRSVRNLSNGLMQVRRFNGGRLAGIKAVLRAMPEKIWYYDRSGNRDTTVAYILSLEIPMQGMAIAAEQSGNGWHPNPQKQYVVQETAAERAQDIAPEFYPERTSDESVDESTDPTQDDDAGARICQLARRLGYREVRIKMLLVQWSRNLPDLERKLVAELDLRLEPLPAEKYCHRIQPDRDHGQARPT